MKIQATSLAALLVLATPMAAQAHKAWVLPSQTVLSAEDPWITVDAAVSNDLFYFNHVPLRLDALVITAPDGSTAAPANPATGKFRSTFDVHLDQQGTWRIALFSNAIAQPRGPATATPREPVQSIRRNETFVTAGKPSSEALKPTGVGIELATVTHPNDLFAGDKADFRFLIDGKPASGLEIEIVPGGSRYRDRQNEIKLVSAEDGSFSVTWPEAGMYWIEASASDDKATIAPAKQRRMLYTATVEVLPQ